MAAVPLNQNLVENIVAIRQTEGYRQLWTDYDAQADVLYISFRKPQQANDSVMEGDGSIHHYRDDELVGISVLSASQQ
ncbi:MAG: hypothetical protein OHK0046_41150 [Anaerolineae bacterium]